MASESVLSLGGTRDNESRVVGSSEFESAMYSILGRINYSFDSKYMLTANFRRDGSSNFSKKIVMVISHHFLLHGELAKKDL